MERNDLCADYRLMDMSEEYSNKKPSLKEAIEKGVNEILDYLVEKKKKQLKQKMTLDGAHRRKDSGK